MAHSRAPLLLVPELVLALVQGLVRAPVLALALARARARVLVLALVCWPQTLGAAPLPRGLQPPATPHRPDLV
jgi:hypothetical protein